MLAGEALLKMCTANGWRPAGTEMVTTRVEAGSKVMEGLIFDGTPEYARDEMSGICMSGA
jgi:hypothetical protein